MTMAIFQILVCFLLFIKGFSSPCKPRIYGENSVVCVCDENYCDDLVLLNIPEPVSYESNKDGARFESQVLNFTSVPQPGVPIFSPNQSVMNQFILGFGGAFTDTTGINIGTLSKQMQNEFLNSYFSDNGLQYNMGRVPMASTDCSTHQYSYDDVSGDFNLTHFNLANEDHLYKIPYIKAANVLSNNTLLLFGSPWSAPGWMKTNGKMNGGGSLIGAPGGPYYNTWADYFVKFLKAYENYNITFWGLTLQNEPTDGCLDNFWFQAMCFTPEKQRDFLKIDLGPALQKAGYTTDNLRLMIMDDVRGLLPQFADIVMSDDEAAQYVSGIAFHWYYENFTPHKLLDITHGRHPELFFLSTEACTGYLPWELPKVDLGNWKRAERYAHDIIQDLLNWSIGWIDWNLALNLEGGPNWVNNYVDSPIIINATGNEFYKQPMYYAVAHFSKVLPRGSYRIGLDSSQSNIDENKLEIAAFQTPSDKTVIIVLNTGEENVQFTLHDSSRGFLNVNIKPHAIQSYVW